VRLAHDHHFGGAGGVAWWDRNAATEQTSALAATVPAIAFTFGGLVVE